MDEYIEIQQKLIERIDAWAQAPDFVIGKHNAKLKRSKNLVAGTDPRVLVEILGIREVPDDPKAAMQLVRTLDLKTLKDLEVFIGGDMKLGDKVVGHHSIAGNTIGEALAGMPPDQRAKVFMGIIERGKKTGMDPRQIVSIWDETHKSIAHGGDFKGKKTGAWLGYIPGEDADGFLERFDKSAEIQERMYKAALADPRNVKLHAGYKGASEALGVPNLGDPETPLEIKKGAGQIISKAELTNPIRDIIKRKGDDMVAVTEEVRDLVEKGIQNLPPRAMSTLRAIQAIRGPAIVGALGTGATILSAASDVQAAQEGVSTIKKAPTPRQRVKGTLQATSGASGVASLTPLAPVATPLSIITGGAAAVMDFFDQRRQQRKRDQDVTLGKRSLSSPEDAQVTRTIPHSTLQLNR